MKRNIVRHTVSAAEAGIFESITVKAPVTQSLSRFTVGDYLTPSPGGRVAVSFFAPQNVLLAMSEALLSALYSIFVTPPEHAT